MPTEPPVITVSCCFANYLHKDTTIVNIDQLTESSRILIEQDSNPTLFNSKRIMLSLPFDEQALIEGARYMQYFRNKTRNINKNDILKKNKIDLGKVSHLQFFLPGESF